MSKSIEQLRAERDRWEKNLRAEPNSPYLQNKVMQANRALDRALFQAAKNYIPPVAPVKPTQIALW